MKIYIFTTARLGFRPWEAADLEPLCALNMDEAVMEFFPNLQDRQTSQAFIDRMQRTYDELGYCFYAVEKLDNEEFIGFIGIDQMDFPADFTPCAEIGWRLKKSVWNQGLATEGAFGCLDYGFNHLNLNEIYAITATLNKRSERIMEKIGMKKVGEFDHPKLPKGHPLERHVLYNIKNLSGKL